LCSDHGFETLFGTSRTMHGQQNHKRKREDLDPVPFHAAQYNTIVCASGLRCENDAADNLPGG